MPDSTADFGWLRQERGRQRMGSLRMIARSIKRGWLRGERHVERRAALMEALFHVACEDPEATADERLRAIDLILWTQGMRPLRLR